MNRKNKVLVSIGIGALMALGYHIARKQEVSRTLNRWKKDRIRNAYYDNVDETDVAWG